MAVAFSPDGATLASAGRDAKLRLWDPATGRERAVLPGDVATYPALAFSPDGTTLAATWHVRNPDTGFFDGQIKLWDAATGRERAVLPGRDNVSALAFSPAGTTLAATGHTGAVRLWDVATGRERAVLRGPSRFGRAVAFSPDGKTLAATWYAASTTVNKAPGELQLWDVSPGRERVVFREPSALVDHGELDAVAFSPDGTILATGDGGRAVRLRDPTTGRVRATLVGHTASVASVAFSPDGRFLASGSNSSDGSQSGKLWDVALALRESTATPPAKAE